ncbi:MAG: NAD-dependent epimerase/dehydratase family protein [Planctomycetes bacterium]|nr:NAD-dependent epimerase/dehydratase family protein [Planctomycetota bacterium]
MQVSPTIRGRASRGAVSSRGVPRTLITGATGFLGSAVLRALLEAGHSVRALVRPTSRRDNLAGLRVEPAEGDLLDPASLARALEGCEALFHVAADYRLWARDPSEILSANVEGTRSILAAAHAAGVRRVVYTSSVAAVGLPEDGRPGTEADRADPLRAAGPYKRSKVLAEEEARVAFRGGLDVVIVNPSTPVGPRDLRPTPTGRIVLDFLRGRMPAYVDTGLNIIDVDDCARGHVQAYERGVAGERYILGGENLSLREVLGLLAAQTGRAPPRLRIPWWLAWAAGAASTAWASVSGREPAVPLDGVRMARRRMFFDSSRARAELGLETRPAREALGRAARWFLDHGYA